MEYRHLGDSGLRVPVLCLGAMTFGEADDKSFMHKVGCDEKTSFAIMSRALERGVNFIDTADVYGQDGLSERVVGKWMAETKSRDRVVLATKFRFRMGEGPNSSGRVALPHRADGGGQPAAPGDRPHRPLPDPHARHRHAGGGDAPRARRSRARRQGPVPRREQLHGLSPHRQPVDLEDRAPAPVRRPADAIQPARARPRARARPGVQEVRARRPSVVAARLGLPVRQVREGPAAPSRRAPREVEGALRRFRHRPRLADARRGEGDREGEGRRRPRPSRSRGCSRSRPSRRSSSARDRSSSSTTTSRRPT